MRFDLTTPRVKFSALMRFLVVAIIVTSSMTLFPRVINSGAQPTARALDVRNLTTGEVLTHFEYVPASILSGNGASLTSNTSTLAYSDRHGKEEDNGDWNVFLRTIHFGAKNSTRGIELGSDSISIQNITLPKSKEISISGELPVLNSNVKQKTREQAPSTLPIIDPPKPVIDFLNNNLELLNVNSSDHLSHYIVIHSHEDKYAKKILNIKDQFVTTIAFYDKYANSESKGELDVFIQISHLKDKVNSLRVVQLGNDDIKISIDGRDQGAATKAAEIRNLSSGESITMHQGFTASIHNASGSFTLNYTDSPHQLTKDQMERAAEELDSVDVYTPTRISEPGHTWDGAVRGPEQGSQSIASVANNPANPTNGTANTIRTSYSQGSSKSWAMMPIQQAFADGDPNKTNVYVVGNMPGTSSSVAEPAAANNNKIVFYTSNFLAAMSDDNGRTGSWKFANPRDMPTFCCDQDVIFHDRYGVFIWYRQGYADVNGENTFRLSISKDAVNWWFWDFQPKEINAGWVNQWFDYPHIALSAHSLWITSNMYDNNTPAKFKGAVALELPMDDLSRGKGFAYNIYPIDQFSPTPVQGASDTMYVGAHLGNNEIAIYSMTEGGGPYPEVDRYIDAYTVGYRQGSKETATDAAKHVMSCPGPDSINWCARSDDRITNGWTSSGYVGFFWNARQGGIGYCSPLGYDDSFHYFNPYSLFCTTSRVDDFPYPYIDGAVFDLGDDFRYVARPYVWNTDHAWSYASSSPNLNLLGIAAFYGGGKYYPGENVAIQYIKEPLSSRPLSSGPSFSGLVDSNGGPSDSSWGDYIRVRPYAAPDDPFNHLWIATAFTYNKNNPIPGVDTVKTYYAIFGRDADAPKEGPSIEITAPANGYYVTSYSPVTLTADASLSGHPLSDDAIKWNSNIEGFLGTGKSISHVFRYAKDGPQTITATITYDYPSMSASDSITLNMKFPHRAPSPIILEPKAGLNVAVGATLFLKGYAARSDPEQNGSLGWTDCTRMSWQITEEGTSGPITRSIPSSRDSNFDYNGLCNAEVSFSTAGTKTIRLSATNSVGDVGYAEVSVNAVQTSASSFDVSAYPESQSASTAGDLAYHVAVTQEGGSPKPVSLTVTGVPAGVSSKWQCTSGGSSPCTIPSYTTDLILSVKYGAYSAGTYTITITGISVDGTTRSVSVTLVLSSIR